MIITINIQNKQDYQWLAPFLEALQKYPGAKVEIQQETTDQSWASKISALLAYTDAHSKIVDKIQIPDRDERNAR